MKCSSNGVGAVFHSFSRFGARGRPRSRRPLAPKRLKLWKTAPTLLLVFCATACVRRDGRNNDCQWPAEAPAPLDLTDASQRRHLIGDIEFAEELGLRHGDSFRGRETVPDRGRRVDECTARLLQWVAVLHNVTPETVEQVRGSRDWRIDLVAVFAPMTLLLWVAADRVGVRLRRRFTPDETTARLVASLLLAVVLAICLGALGELWSWTVEMTRVGNGHLSYRAFRMPWTRFRLAIFAAAAVLSWAAIWRRGRSVG